jgi:hypothetical protein
MQITGIENLDEFEKAFSYMADGISAKVATKVVLESNGADGMHTDTAKSMRIVDGALIISTEE